MSTELTSEEHPAAPPAPAVAPIDSERRLPLSFAQRRLWLLDQLLPSGSVYNLPRVVRLAGELDLEALRRAFDELVRRHESLRTRFEVHDGEPVQVIEPRLSLALELEDLSALAPAQREAEAQRRAQAEAQAPFDLERGPLVRARLLRLAPSEHWLLLSLHHIVTDGWSMGVLFNELSALYGAYRQGEASPLAELPVQYADYALWQREWLQGEVLEQQLAYWRQALTELPVLELPTDRPRPMVASYRGARVSFELGETLTRGLKELSRREGATLFMTLLAAFQVLLYRYSGQEDLAVGVPIAGRSRPELEGLIGFFVNTLVLRADLSGAPSFREHLARVRTRALEAYAHQDLPFEKLVEALAPTRDLSRNPLFQVSFTKGILSALELQLAGFEPEDVVETDTHTAKFDLAFDVVEKSGKVRFLVDYATDLFEAGTIERLVGHWRVLLEGIVADPGQAISQLPLLTEAERHQLLIEWNDTAVEYPCDRCIHQLFEEQVERSPEATALVYETQQLTYGELNARANQLAHHLRSLGVGPEVLVGVCLERSLELVVGLLAILKAGGAYVPLDPSYPAQRLAFMLEDTAAPVLLTQAKLRERLPAYGGRIVSLDADWPEIARGSKDDPKVAVSPRNLAYVIYTSGSTGRPKGTCIEHRSVVRLVKSTNYVELGPDEVFLQFAPISFDASTFELWGSLLNGAKLVVCPAGLLSLQELGRVIREHGVTTLWLTAALFHQMVDAQLESLRGVRQLLAGGETLSVSHVRRMLEVIGGGRLINGYGPTENTTFTCCHVMRADSRIENSVPIGRPISNTQVYILDGHMQPVPVGAYGELYIGGDGLAREYLHQPQLTVEKFVPDPFSNDPGARLYRSGDLVRYLPGGNIEFFGRIDDQVKIRGFRIELGEIASVLAEHPAVRQAVVLAREDTPGDKRLVAYVVPADRSSADSGPLRAFLRERLPEYMQPAAYVLLERLPLTPNGKVDQRALPAPQYGRADIGGAYVPPRNTLEELIAEVWCEVLQLERVGVNDNFFELGGHSLLAAQVLARLARLLKVELPLRGLFETPTVSALAAEAEKKLGAQEPLQAAPIVALPRTGDLPLSFAQQRLWFLDRLLPDKAAYTIPAAWRLRGPLDALALQRSLDALVTRHETLRTRFAESEGGPVQLIDPPQSVALPLADLSAMAQGEREAHARQIADAHARQPFDLEAGPLLRAQLLRLAAEEHLLLLNVHHIVFDGWSLDVFDRELSAMYNAFVRGRKLELPALPIQYADYARWQREWLQGEVLERQLAYWRTKLAGLTMLELPTDRPWPPVQSFRGAHQSLTLSPELSAALKALGRREGATLFMTLLTAFQVLLYRYSGQEDIAVGTPIAGRGRTELEGLIGFFVNTLVLRSDLSGNPSFRDLLRRARESALAAYSHQDLPFEKLVEELAPKRDPSRNPLFDVMINYVDRSQPALDLPGLAVQQIGPPSTSAKFAMTLYVGAHEQEVDLRLVYQSELFSPARIASMLEQYVHLLGQIARAPEKSVRDYSLVTASARACLPDPTIPLQAAPQESVVAQVLTWARSAPDSTAVTAAGRQWTYAELTARATSLATTLQAMGIGRGDVVAIIGPRSFGLIGTMLAVLMSGGAFLTIDPALPAQRKRVMLGEARARAVCLIGQQADSGRYLEPGDTLAVLRTDLGLASHLGPARHPDHAWSPPTIHGDDPAYVFFTSGSTGRPKAILGCHKGLSHFLHWQRGTFAIGAQDRVSQLIALTFDPLLRDVFLPLTSGATLCVPAESDLLDTIGWMKRAGVTVAHTTPTVMQSWLRDGERQLDLPSLRWLFICGEPLTDVLIGKWRRTISGPAQLVNLYGPSETTMVRCFYIIPPAVTQGVQPIGLPLADSQALVLNAAGLLCGIGEIGEIVLRTPYCTLGYLNLPEENERRFRSNPFGNDPTDLVYFTGDLGRYRPDGLLEIAGRVDDQVKIRGIRIDPGEVTAMLARHEAVRNCVVVGRKDTEGQHQLVGYVVADTGKQLDARDLRAYLTERLPQAFAPGTFVFLDALPVLPNGKVDHKRLPAPQRGSATSEDEIGAPRNALEEQVAAMWADVLGLERVGVHHDFFELGGHSLLAMQLVSRIRSVFGVQIPLQALFVGPTIAAVTRRIEGFLGHLASSPAPALAPLDTEQYLPLSFAQQRLWLLDQLLASGSVYNIPRVVRLRGALEVEALTKALSELVRRHESLRTRFEVHDGEPVQVIEPRLSLALELEDLSALAPAQREAEAQRRAQAEAQAPFDLERGPLVRARLLRLAPSEHWLLLSLHHIVTDGWSMGVLFNELSALYGAYRQGEASPLAELPVQYADYALWQREWLQGEVLEQQLAYWRQALTELPVLELPTDRPRPMVASYRGARVSFELGEALTRGLKELSRREGATLFMTLLAAFQVLLYRYSGQEDLAVGVPIAGRSRPELEGLIGFFVNTLVLRADLSGAPSFREHLARVRTRALEAYAHQDLPFEKLVEALAPTRDLSRNPLFQVSLVLQNTPPGELKLDGLEALPLRGLGSESAKFDLSLELTESAGRLSGSIQYATDLFEAATIERLVGHWRVLLEAIVADPGQAISQLPLLTEAERHQLLIEWNDTAVEYPRDRCIHQLFEEQVERSPEATALVYETQQLTYGELNARANQLAHHLRSLGVGPEVLVGVCLERSLELVVGLLAILKAGGAYVPLDPSYPAERLAFMLQDTQAPVLLTQQRLLARLPAYSGHTLCLERDAAHIAQHPDTNPPASSSPTNLAYVIYTSGSTGTPKGVMIEQRSLVNHMLWMQRRFPLSAADRVLQKTPASADASVWEFFAPLTVGAQLVMAAPEVHRSPVDLMETAQRYAITIIQFVPSLLAAIIENPGLAECGALRRVFCGGEPLPQETARRFKSQCAAELVNLYGPTEVTIDSTFHVYERSEDGRSVLVGKPIDNLCAYVVDSAMQPVPAGTKGELLLGGVGVARGYLNQPTLTAERFIANPFGSVTCDRLYRTGDLVRRHPDGNIEFLGRRDRQVKILGSRIEPGEIETTLSEHPDVADAVVVPHRAAHGSTLLVAYFVPSATRACHSKALRRYLKSQLPEHMVPAFFIELESFPRLPNGKLDRSRLPEPRDETVVTDDEFVAPGTPLEQMLVDVWRSVLQVDRVGIHHNFFEIGGHSLLAAQVVARIRDAHGVPVSVRDLFANPTVAALSRFVEDLRVGPVVEQEPKLVPTARQAFRRPRKP